MEAVQRIRKAHENKKLQGVEWESIKNTITRRERVYLVYQQEFQGNWEAFAAYLQVELPSTGKGGKRKKPGDDGLISFNLFANSMIHTCEDVIRKEKEKAIYMTTDGYFSEHLWKEKWGSYNKFTVFHLLCLERINLEKQKEIYMKDDGSAWIKEYGKFKHWFEVYSKLIKG